MTIIDDFTPTQYGIGGGRMLIRGKTLATLDIQLHVRFYNAADQSIGDRYVPLTFTDPQKQALIDAVAAKLAELEAQTGLTNYIEQETPMPT